MPKGTVYVAGTCDTKGAELAYVADLVRGRGLPVAVVDLSTSGRPAAADVAARSVAERHPGGADAVFTGDRGTAVAAMAEAFARWLAARDDVAGVLGLGGSGGTALVTPAMQRLPVGTPKLMVSTVASGTVAAYVGPTDLTMMHSVTDVAGLNRISRRILANAAGALAGRVSAPAVPADDSVPAVGLSMFGVTTPCVNEIVARIGARYDCLVFHATGTGGQAMEKLLDSGLVAGLIDATTTEVCDLLFGGVLPATPDRFGAVARTGRPYVGSCGALDMVNFGPRASVPERYRDRRFYVHNPQVTLMRTSAAENAEVGRWIAERLNACDGEVRFFLPEGGVSLIDTPGQPFHDPAADAALFEALEATLVQTPKRRLVRMPQAINDPDFARAMADTFLALAG
jgi:uncharacterized protein (UPF0261 family)